MSDRLRDLVLRFREWWSGPGWDAPVARERIREEAMRLIGGEITEREFVSWVHTHVGHMGDDDDLLELVVLDDEYDPFVFPDKDRWFRESAEAESVRSRVRDAAGRLLADG